MLFFIPRAYQYNDNNGSFIIFVPYFSFFPLQPQKKIEKGKNKKKSGIEKSYKNNKKNLVM